MLKVKPQEDYPPEPGCYLVGNYYSPVAVVVLLNAPYGRLPAEVAGIPEEISNLIKVAIETGAAIAGTLQTENIGVEKIIVNIASNPNIRYLVLCGREVEGHNTGDALKALIENGINEKKTIIGSKAATPYLFNIPLDAIEIFRNQVTLVDLIGEVDREMIAKAVWSCFQEEPTPFKGYSLHDPGAYSKEARSFRVSMRIKHPEEIEEWEIDQILKDIEEPEKPAEKLKKIGGEDMRGGRGTLAITKRLLKITGELSEIARLCIEMIEGLEAPSVEELKKEEGVIREKTEPAVKPVAVAKEGPETEGELYFTNQLRGYSGVLAALEALNRDICHNGCSLPATVITAQKRLKRLKEGIDISSLSERKKQELEEKVNNFMKKLELLPQDKSQPCQKTVGTCTIGSGCFASGALKLMELITEPAPPKNL